MYDKSDPRATLQGKSGGAAEYAGVEYARFYIQKAQEEDSLRSIWYARGQNFILLYAEMRAGAVFERNSQSDEYVVINPDPKTTIGVSCNGEEHMIEGETISMIPPGDSKLTFQTAGRAVLLFTAANADLACLCCNAESYNAPHPNIPNFEAWPEPIGGLKFRSYTLQVPDEPGRFGRIWRSMNFMVNFTPAQHGPRDTTKLSPHHHDSFEQGSFVLEGSFIHHVRWPWTPNMNQWRVDEHELCGKPSLAVIPPPSVHTSMGIAPGLNQLIDIFSPPRFDFSSKPGWVLNAADYPSPSI